MYYFIHGGKIIFLPGDRKQSKKFNSIQAYYMALSLIDASGLDKYVCDAVIGRISYYRQATVVVKRNTNCIQMLYSQFFAKLCTKYTFAHL